LEVRNAVRAAKRLLGWFLGDRESSLIEESYSLEVLDVAEFQKEGLTDTVSPILGNGGVDAEVARHGRDDLVGRETALVDVEQLVQAIEGTGFEGNRGVHGSCWGYTKREVVGADDESLVRGVEVLLDMFRQSGGGTRGRNTSSARPHIRCHVKGATHCGRKERGRKETRVGSKLRQQYKRCK
jgi:hypothetical protein